MSKFSNSMLLTAVIIGLLSAASAVSANTLISVALGWAGSGPGIQSGQGATPSQAGHRVPLSTVAAAPSTGFNMWDYLGTDSSYYSSGNYTAPLTLSSMDDANGNATNVSLTYTNTPLAGYPNPTPWIERTSSGTPIVPGAAAFISFPTATWNSNNGTDVSSPAHPLNAALTFSGLNPKGSYNVYIYSAYVNGNTAAGANTPTVSLKLIKGTATVTSYKYTYNMEDTKLLSRYRLGRNFEEFHHVKPDSAGQIAIAGAAVNSSLFNAVQLVSHGKFDHAAPLHFFRVSKVHGVWWVINPQGKQTLVKGVGEVRTLPYIEKLEGVWGKEMIPTQMLMPWQGTHRCRPTSLLSLHIQAKHLLSWGFNNAGAWSDPQCSGFKFKGRVLSFSPELNIGVSYQGSARFPDVFNPGFAAFANKLCMERCAPWKNDPNILGWYSDNELAWGPGWGGNPMADGMLLIYLNFPPKSPGHNAAVAFLRKQYGEISTLNQNWHAKFKSWRQLALATHVPEPFTSGQFQTQAGAEYLRCNRVFTGMVASRYSRICRDAIKAADPNHLYLGQKFPGFPGTLVAAADAKYTDVISLDIYNVINPTPFLEHFVQFNKPIIIAEFSFRAKDSGLPNTIGSGLLVDTQTQRAADMVRYLHYALSLPQVVGYQWWEYIDEPVWGRWPSPEYHGGENSNYGLIRRNAKPYKLIVRAFTKLNADAEKIHARAHVSMRP